MKLKVFCFFVFIFVCYLFSPNKKDGKIYDCFLFFNEFEILEIRLNELYDHVDYFVLVESGNMHRTGEKKPYYFEKEKKRFSKFLDKIIHIKLEDTVETTDPWVRENWERNQIMRGLKNCSLEDLVLISDVDEIIPGSMINKLYKASKQEKMIGFRQRMYRWFLNRYVKDRWTAPVALRFKHLSDLTPQEAREQVRGERISTIWNGGWHFTSMGGYQKNQEKYYGIVEGGDQFLSYDRWKEQIDGYKLVPIDRKYPKYIQKNTQRFNSLGLIDNRCK